MKKSNPPPEKSPDTQCPEGEINGNKGVKIYFLPSLMTSGNLFCGFLALTKIVEADIASHDFASIIKQALFFIFLACLFDALDGRVAAE